MRGFNRICEHFCTKRHTKNTRTKKRVDDCARYVVNMRGEKVSNRGKGREYKRTKELTTQITWRGFPAFLCSAGHLRIQDAELQARKYSHVKR